MWRALSQNHASTSMYARSKGDQPHDRRTYSSTIRTLRVFAPGLGSTGLELRQLLECARPATPGAEGVRFALQHNYRTVPPRVQWSHSSACSIAPQMIVRSAVPFRPGAMFHREIDFFLSAISNVLERSKECDWKAGALPSGANLPLQDSNLQFSPP